MNNQTTKQAYKKPRNPTGKGGFKDHPESRNNGGRPRNPLKEYQRERFSKMSDKEKEKFLMRVNAIDRWKMAEGNPDTNTDITTDGEKINTVDPKVIALAKEYEDKIKKEL